MIVRIGKLQLRLYASILEQRTGVCSQNYSNLSEHCLLWDFDYSKADDIYKSLKVVQKQYSLPSIYLIQSSQDSYHAYCLVAKTFREVIAILSATPEIDLTYLKLGIVRGYFTLRITPRKNEPNFRIYKILPSVYKNEMMFEDLTINEYLTSNKGGKYAKS